MLVKVKRKSTGQIAIITRTAYNMTSHKYEFIGEVKDGADLSDAAIQSESQEQSPNQSSTANHKPTKTEQEPVKGAEAVEADKAPKAEPKRRGRKPANQISSPAAAVEV